VWTVEPSKEWFKEGREKVKEDSHVLPKVPRIKKWIIDSPLLFQAGQEWSRIKNRLLEACLTYLINRLC